MTKCRLEKGHLMASAWGSSLLPDWQADGCCHICIIAPLIKALRSLLIASPSPTAHSPCIGLLLLSVAVTHFSLSKPDFICHLWSSLAQLCKEILSALIWCSCMASGWDHNPLLCPCLGHALAHLSCQFPSLNLPAMLSRSLTFSSSSSWQCFES